MSRERENTVKRLIIALFLGGISTTGSAQFLQQQIATIQSEFRTTVFDPTEAAPMTVVRVSRVVTYCGPFSPVYYESLRTRRVFHPYYRPIRSPRRFVADRSRTPPAVPEPATVAMLLGAGALVALRKKGRKCV